MKKLKKISIFILLIVLTCCVVFLPQLISRQREKDILNKIVYRNYSTGNRPKLTSEQVARLYYNGEINIGYNVLSSARSENSDTETVREDVIDLIEFIFGEDETVCEPIKAIIAGSNISYSRNSCLIKIDNQPTALNFVSCSVKKEDWHLEILYEEKTKTVIAFSCGDFTQEFENTKETDLYFEKADMMISNYYEKQLHFSKAEYYSTITKKGPNAYLSSIYISCGVVQYDEKVMSEEDYTN